jgi:hypothetical protein
MVQLLSIEYSIDHIKFKSNAYYKYYEEVSTDTFINDLVEKIGLLKDKLIEKEKHLMKRMMLKYLSLNRIGAI